MGKTRDRSYDSKVMLENLTLNTRGPRVGLGDFNDITYPSSTIGRPFSWPVHSNLGGACSQCISSRELGEKILSAARPMLLSNCYLTDSTTMLSQNASLSPIRDTSNFPKRAPPHESAVGQVDATRSSLNRQT